MEKLSQLLNRSFDEKLTNEEEHQLETALSNNPGLRKEKQEVEEVRALLSDYNPAFEEGFTKRVLAATDQYIQNGDNLFYLFKRFVFGSAAAIAALLVSVYLTDGTISFDSLLGISDINSDTILLALSNF
jgi:hypothetical protein